MKIWTFLVGILFLWSAPVCAQTMEIADGEKVAMAFYKLSGLQPGFMAWAEDTDAYQEAPLAMREEIMAREVARLEKEYKAFSPALNVLNVMTTAEVDLQEVASADDALKKNYYLSWKYANGDAEFFPYVHRDTYFAVVPRKVENFQNAEITKEQYQYFKEKLKGSQRAKLIVQLRGHSADPNKPINLRGQDFWAMAANVAGVSLWDRQGSLLWESTASWYVSPRTQSLNSLHEDKRAVAQQ